MEGQEGVLRKTPPARKGSGSGSTQGRRQGRAGGTGGPSSLITSTIVVGDGLVGTGKRKRSLTTDQSGPVNKAKKSKRLVDSHLGEYVRSKFLLLEARESAEDSQEEEEDEYGEGDNE